MKSKKSVMDGCTATTYISYALSDVATIYPISPASDMGELADMWANNGIKNLYGQPMVVREMESELGAAGAVHGSLCGGALATTYTASQGLMLMIPNMYKIAGELLPAVFHVTTRSLSTHALSIFGDHQDVMACRQTGFAFLASSSVQECMDLALVAHLAAIEGSIPVCHFFDGMRTSSEMETIETIEYDDIAPLINYDKIKDFRKRAMNPEHPEIRGTAQDPDVYFQNREAANLIYDTFPEIVENKMNDVYRITGRKYGLFDYVGDKEAEFLIVSMGSSCDVIEETIDYLLKKGEKIGLIKVRLYRPFSVDSFISVISDSVKLITVLDRTKEPGSQGEPLFQDICTALLTKEKFIKVIGGRYGLSSKDLTPSMVKAVYENMKSETPKLRFTVGINDDVSKLSLEITEKIETTPEGTIQCKFFGIGSDGTVGANKQASNIIGDNTDLYVQAYFSYDSKKSEGYTVSHLRFGNTPIKSAYLITDADYIACHKDSYVNKFDILEGIKENGVFILNSSWTLQEMEQKLPANMRREIANKNLKFYNIDAEKIASEVGLGIRINMIMQTVFFKLSNVLDFEKAISLLKTDIKKIYEKEGDDIVFKNIKAVDMTITAIQAIKYPSSWLQAEEKNNETEKIPDFIKNVAKPILALKGNSLPVSLFAADGKVPPGTTAYEKRGVAVSLPEWDDKICIECTQCSFVCPHAAIRPYLATAEELAKAPQSFIVKKAKGGDVFLNLNYRIQIYPEDCVGCESCVNVCPVKALSMKPYDELIDTQKINLDFAKANITVKDNLVPRNSIRGSQFQQPLLEFSGCCAGCGETPYVKLVTQLFGERMIVANATGCSSIWGASMPSMPYTINKNGQGPAWGNSLFEDAAEYGYGIATAIKQRRDKLEILITQAVNQAGLDKDTCEMLNEWLVDKEDPEKSIVIGNKLKENLNKYSSIKIIADILDSSDLLGKKSIWIIGGDGWAYDIGYGGLDHVLASGENVNILVLDTECYSNTGGQTSKATPLGAIAKFSSVGKRTNKKDLGRMAMVYGSVYVASVSIGANKEHTIQALTEAENYNGPSIVIAYCPCINHGLRKGMGMNIIEESRAVASGYWPLYRYNPENNATGKDPLTIDYQKPDGTLSQYLDGEDRYADLEETLPKESKILQSALSDTCEKLFEILKNRNNC